MRTRRLHRGVLSGFAVLVGLCIPVNAFAVQSVVYNKNTCKVTAIAPTLTATKQLTGSASITCTAATTVTLIISVVELDGTTLTTEDPTVEVKLASVSVNVTAGGTVTTKTATATCVSTETGNEEFATKAQVSFGIISGVSYTSVVDRTVPKLDSFAC